MDRMLHVHIYDSLLLWQSHHTLESSSNMSSWTCRWRHISDVVCRNRDGSFFTVHSSQAITFDASIRPVYEIEEKCYILLTQWIIAYFEWLQLLKCIYHFSVCWKVSKC